SAAGLRPKTKKKQIDTSERLQLLDVPGQFIFQIGHVGAHRREAFDLLKESFAQQALKISDKVQRVVHAERRQRVLGENMKAAEQAIESGCLRHLGDQAIHCLRTSAA